MQEGESSTVVGYYPYKYTPALFVSQSTLVSFYESGKNSFKLQTYSNIRIPFHMRYRYSGRGVCSGHAADRQQCHVLFP